VTRNAGDAGLYSRLADQFGYRCIDCAQWTSLRHVRAFMAQERAILALAVDGPAGPPGMTKYGVVKLASMTSAPVVPLRCSATRTVRQTTTWDRRYVPLPFGELTIFAGQPLEIARSATACDLVAAAEAIDEVLAALGPLRA
jgi:lysophospholipid acyltransferase (LPLAT)-like uncharacterized protein